MLDKIASTLGECRAFIWRCADLVQSRLRKMIHQRRRSQKWSHQAVWINALSLIDPANATQRESVSDYVSRNLLRVRSREITMIAKGVVVDVAKLALAVNLGKVAADKRQVDLHTLLEAEPNRNRLYRTFPMSVPMAGLGTPVLVIEARDGTLYLADGHKRIHRMIETGRDDEAGSESKLRHVPALIVDEDDCRPYLAGDAEFMADQSIFSAVPPNRIADWQWSQGVPFAENPDMFLGGTLLSPALHDPRGGGVSASQAERRVKDAIAITIVRLKTLQRLLDRHGDRRARRSELRERMGVAFDAMIAGDYDDLVCLSAAGSQEYTARLQWEHLERNIIPGINYRHFGYADKKSMLAAFSADCQGQAEASLRSREAGMYQQIVLLLRSLVRIHETEKFIATIGRALDGKVGLKTKNPASVASNYARARSAEFQAATAIDASDFFFLLSPLVGDALVEFYPEFDLFREMVEIIGFFERFSAKICLNSETDDVETMPDWMTLYILQRFAIAHQDDVLKKHWEHSLFLLGSMGFSAELIHRSACERYKNFPEHQGQVHMVTV